MGFLAANKIGPMLNDMNVDVTFEGDNTVMMEQVAKAALDGIKAAGRAALNPPPLPAINQTDLGLGCCSALLNWRRKSLAAELAREVAGAGGNGGDAFDANVDLALKVGWAEVDASTFDTFREEATGAPPALREVLSLLCLLYGLSRVEGGLETYLAGGALGAQALSPLRKKIAALCGKMNENGGKMALQVVGGFGIPNHLVQAPIAVGNWRTMK